MIRNLFLNEDLKMVYEGINFCDVSTKDTILSLAP